MEEIVSKGKTLAFLYHLMRDHLPVGQVEALVRTIESLEGDIIYTNGWLAKYAENLAARIKD